MFDFIFDNTGRKLQALAKIIFCLCALAGVISFFYFILSGLGSTVNSNPLLGLVTLLSGLLGGWLSSVPIYGFGVIIENSEQAIAERNSLGRSSRLMNSGAPAATGTWTCRCGTLNPDTRKLCENCASSRDDAAISASRNTHRNVPAADDWTCTCGAVNPPSRGQCDICGAYKPVVSERTPAATPKPPAAIAADRFDGVWRCSCGGVTALNRSICDRCGVRRPSCQPAIPDAPAASGEEWRCSCGRMNSDSLSTCSACHLQRLRYSEAPVFHPRKSRGS